MKKNNISDYLPNTRKSLAICGGITILLTIGWLLISILNDEGWVSLGLVFLSGGAGILGTMYFLGIINRNLRD